MAVRWDDDDSDLSDLEAQQSGHGQLSDVSESVRWLQPNLPGMDLDAQDVLRQVMRELQDIKRRLPEPTFLPEHRFARDLEQLDRQKRRVFVQLCNGVKAKHPRSKMTQTFVADMLGVSSKTIQRKTARWNLDVSQLPWSEDT